MAELRAVLVVAIAMTRLAVAQQLGAMMEPGPGLSPRYFGQALEVRQDVCPSSYHACDDIGLPSSCCPNDNYCYVDSTGKPSCCALGSNCDNICTGTGRVNQYLCTTTATVSGAIASNSACCARSCSTDLYLCPSSLGGRCCSLGLTCGTSSCLSTVTAPTTLVPIIPSGCTKGQFSCDASVGGGCCNTGATCTDMDNTLVCLSGTTGPSAIRTGPDGTLVSGIVQTSPNTGLSTGAKAGIGVGIAVVGCLVIAGLLWFCMRRRDASRGARTASHRTESVAGGQAMSQSSGHAARQHGMADYFSAAAGPFTDNESPGSVPHRGVPLSPDGPGDIVPAVEIGHSREHSNVTSPGPVVEQKPVPETMEDRVELP